MLFGGGLMRGSEVRWQETVDEVYSRRRDVGAYWAHASDKEVYWCAVMQGRGLFMNYERPGSRGVNT